jgi:hypothetical protein
MLLLPLLPLLPPKLRHDAPASILRRRAQAEADIIVLHERAHKAGTGVNSHPHLLFSSRVIFMLLDLLSR